MSIVRNFKRFERELIDAVKDSIEEHEERIKPQIISATPQDTGQLRESYKFGETDNSQESSKMLQYRISFGPVQGDNGENYAAEVHEWPNNKNWTTEGTGHKFLQRPVLETAQDWLSRLRESYKKLESSFSGGRR